MERRPSSLRRATISHEFVEFIPDELVEGTLYISIPYATAVHLCACGCGIKVVTPISPPEWELLWDGDTVSLDPSIGNWQFPCRSHYWIRRSQIRWARPMSEEEIAVGRRYDARERDAYFGARTIDAETAPSARPTRRGASRRVVDFIKRVF
jgi:hypothetical protein